jgi:hypothetical protein
MSVDDTKRRFRRGLMVASTLVVTGLVISALSLGKLNVRARQQTAQATPPVQSTPGAETKPSAPAEPVTTGTSTRPPDVPPEPARPDAGAQKAGAQPALPRAPAEKTAPPIKER